MSVSLQFVNGSDERVVAYLRAFSPRLRAELTTAMERITIDLRDRIVALKLSGQVLKNRTGTLRRSVHTVPVEVTDSTITGAVGVGSKAWYGKLHEYGGIYPVAAAERVSSRGKRFMVRAYTIHLPERSFMRSTLREQQGSIKSALEAAMRRAVNV